MRSNFSTGLIAGTMIGVGMALMVNPMDKRDIKMTRHRVGRVMRNINNAMFR